MQEHTQNVEYAQQVLSSNEKFAQLRNEISQVIVGQESIVTHALIALLCDGHILLEGLPGVAKTTLIKTMAQALGLSFSRIQFTPDLLPADVVGSTIYNPKTQEFTTKKGPIFANLVLADEINRAPAKVQAALLEAMQEKQITIGSTTYTLQPPFLVFATQNPVENEGTYPLPEAQIDRFLLKLHVGYPSLQEEQEIVKRFSQRHSVQNVLSLQDVVKAQEVVADMYVDERLIAYMVNLVYATRDPKKYNLDLQQYIQFGASPRASIALYKTAQAHAFLQSRHFVLPEDVKAVAKSVLRHRVLVSYQAEIDGITSEDIIDRILQTIAKP